MATPSSQSHTQDAGGCGATVLPQSPKHTQRHTCAGHTQTESRVHAHTCTRRARSPVPVTPRRHLEHREVSVKPSGMLAAGGPCGIARSSESLVSPEIRAPKAVPHLKAAWSSRKEVTPASHPGPASLSPKAPRSLCEVNFCNPASVAQCPAVCHTHTAQSQGPGMEGTGQAAGSWRRIRCGACPSQKTPGSRWLWGRYGRYDLEPDSDASSLGAG